MSRHEIGNAETRFVLSERWSPGPMLGWMWMNPSEAGEAKSDPTWTRASVFAKRWGFGAQMAVNPVPFRSPDPEQAIARLRQISLGHDQLGAELLEENFQHIAVVSNRPIVWIVGWGDKGAEMNKVVRVHARALQALSMVRDLPILSFGLTKSGNPKHILARGTSRIPDDADLFRYVHEPRGVGPRFDVAQAVADASMTVRIG